MVCWYLAWWGHLLFGAIDNKSLHTPARQVDDDVDDDDDDDDDSQHFFSAIYL